MTDKRLWRIVLHYVKTAMNRLDLSSLKAFGLDETKSRKGHRYITVFIDLDRMEKPVVFAVAGKGKQTLKAFKNHLVDHGGKAEQVVEVVSDMSGAFISGVNVTDRLKGATDDRVNGATKSGSFSLLDGVNYWSFFALFQVVVFVLWGQFFGER